MDRLTGAHFTAESVEFFCLGPCFPNISAHRLCSVVETPCLSARAIASYLISFFPPTIILSPLLSILSPLPLILSPLPIILSLSKD